MNSVELQHPGRGVRNPRRKARFVTDRQSSAGSAKAVKCPNPSRVSRIVAAAVAWAVQVSAWPAHAAPAPEVEYLYDVTARRHYNVPNNDALGYGHRICDEVSRGASYAQVMSDVKNDVTPNDEFAANYLVSYAVNLLCPGQIWRLRESAAHYQPPAGG